MDDREKKLTNYIDSLNEERAPQEHSSQSESPEMEGFFQTVRMVRSLKEPSIPESDFAKKLANNVNNQLQPVGKATKKPIKRWLLGLAATAAALIIVVNTIWPFGNTNMVYAMEQAFKEVKAYHGVLEVVVTNEAGETSIQSKVEVWADKNGRYVVKGLAGNQKGLITANDGQKKWQVQPGQKEVDIFPAFPDPFSFTLEIGQEIEDVKNAIKTEVVGEELLAGRSAIVMEVTPQGGNPYKIWIDKDTKMPLQKQTAMEYALQYLVRYKDIDFTETVPKELLTYNVPQGFKEVDTNPEQFVVNLDEAKEIVEFTPQAPKDIPASYMQGNIAVVNRTNTVKIDYISADKQKHVVILQQKASGEFKPAAMAVLGKVNDSIAEVQSPVQIDLGVLQGGGVYAGVADISSVRWQQDGYEYAVIGNTSLQELSLFIKGLTNGKVDMSSAKEQSQGRPQVEVPVDLEIEKGDQRNVDAGHAPWKLDPAFVAQVFVSLKISLEGIQGEYPIKYEELKVVQNTGIETVVEVTSDQSPIKNVYLKRLIRQDNTGVWTVVGYDPRNQID